MRVQDGRTLTTDGPFVAVVGHVFDVRDFYSTYYVPANCTVVIAGDFDKAIGEGFLDLCAKNAC